MVDDARPLFIPLDKVASWQIPGGEMQGRSDSLSAALPALQRSFVWEPHQAERMWDSLLRGFPIGAFMLAPYDEARYGRADFQQGRGSEQANYHLLDGQQRATAIALGFYDVWDPVHQEERSKGPSLWVDLEAAPPNDDREYVFRLLTRSHPWGYERADPRNRLRSGNIRDAIAAFRASAPSEYKEVSAVRLPLRYAWPWDAVAPLPVPLLVGAVHQYMDGPKEPVADWIVERLGRLDLWKNEKISVRHGDAKARLTAALRGEDRILWNRFATVVDRTRSILMPSAGIPALVLPTPEHPPKEEIDRGPDAIETLFVRINAGGTPLEGEELIYSLLKSAWTEAPAIIKKLQGLIFTPQRTVAVLCRLYQARDTAKYRNYPPPVPDVGQFRRLIHNEDFHAGLVLFARQNAPKIFENAADLLISAPEVATGQFRLPKVLAAELARGSSGADVMLLLLRWIDRMREHWPTPSEVLDENAQRRLLGFLTAISWFSQDSARCLRRLWKQLQDCPQDELTMFFSPATFQVLMGRDQNEGVPMLPIVSPAVLRTVVDMQVANDPDFSSPTAPYWEKGTWSRWKRLVTEPPSSIDKDLEAWFNKVLLPLWGTADEQLLKEEFRSAWGRFLDRLWSDRRFLLYAQREWLVLAFPDYDPTIPDQIKDTNRPWDFDHIHPQAYVSGLHDRPDIVKEWHSSIGNLRAWPYELNRGDQAIPPQEKFAEVTMQDRIYQLSSVEDMWRASAINGSERELWLNSVPADGREMRYLSQREGMARSNPEYHECRKRLVVAISHRFCEIYRDWYESLHLGDLLP